MDTNESIEMTDPKPFPLRVVLTVTTGLLLTEDKGPRDNGIGDLHEILGHMTSNSPFTHQLGRFGDECKPWLLRWYPELDSPKMEFAVASLSVMLKTESGKADTEKLILGWLLSLVRDGLCHETYVIGRIPKDDHEDRRPIEELVAMRGSAKGIIAVEVQ